MNKGSCLCGTVQFQLLSEPENMSHCHCSICRKIHGTPFATYVQTSGVKWLAGEDNISTFQSSENFHRCFCKTCGSVLPETVDGADYTFVPAGTLEGEVQVRPEKHIFATSKAEWYQISDELPQFEGYSAEHSEGIEQENRAGQAEGVVSGSCQCGDVAFQYPAGSAKFMMWCHCSRCRKVKGAAHATNVFVAPDDLTWLHGEDSRINYNHEGAVRFGNSFCQRCGSSMPRLAEGAPAYNIPAGGLDDAPGVDTKGHIFTGSKSDWFVIHDDYDQFEEMP